MPFVILCIYGKLLAAGFFGTGESVWDIRDSEKEAEMKILQTQNLKKYYEDLDAKFSFCYPEEGRMPENEDEIVLSDLVLEALDIPCEIGAKVPLVVDTGKKTYEKTFTLCGYFQGDRISQSQVGIVSRAHADKMMPTPVTSAMGKELDASEYAGIYAVPLWDSAIRKGRMRRQEERKRKQSKRLGVFIRERRSDRRVPCRFGRAGGH